MGRGPRQMLAAAAVCVAAFWVLLVLAYEVYAAQWLDFAGLSGFVALDHGRIHRVASVLTHVCDPVPAALLGIALLAVALVTRGPRRAAAAAVLLAGANFSSQVLKPALAHPRHVDAFPDLHRIQAEAFPSGHATASMALALAAVLVAPREYRPLVAVVGFLFTLAISLSLLILEWHFPSDVVGGYLLATTWTLLAFAALRASEARWPIRGSMRKAARAAVIRPTPAHAAAAALVALAIAGLTAVALVDDLAGYAQRHTAAIAVGGAIVAAAAALLATVTTLAAGRR